MLEHIKEKKGMMTITTGGVQPTVISSRSITGIWELVSEGLFPVVASGKLETNIRTGTISTVALRKINNAIKGKLRDFLHVS